MTDAGEYHERTKHSPRSVRASDHRLDPATKPRPYKVYRDLPAVDPPTAPALPDVPALSAIAEPSPRPTGPIDAAADPDLHTLCQYATGVTKELTVGGREMRFRAAACTGKLYHVDCYAVTGDCGPFDPGVYHYDPDADAFDVLRTGDYRGVLAAAAGGHDGVAAAPVTVVATSQWWRNAWKYRARTYRHAFWDSGTILANLLATAHAAGHRAEAVMGFADQPVVDLLGVDPDAEAPLELVPVGSGDAAPDPPSVDAIDPAEVPLSPEQEAYPLVPEAWRRSTHPDGDSATEWRQRVRDADRGDVGRRPPGDGDRVALDPVDDDTASGRPVGETIERRGSLREYSHDPISDRKLATVLDRALRGVPTDGGSDAPGRLLDCYCLVHAVDGVPSGAYQYHPDETALERVGPTDRETAGHIALDQPVVGDAAVNVYLVADIGAVVDELGNRGYRLAQLEAGIALGRLYLATYAHLALGGRGFTFYDDLVTEHIAPRADGQSPMTLFAFGTPAG
jgi:SagB-type dehydrogenase family enzyme